MDEFEEELLRILKKIAEKLGKIERAIEVAGNK